MRTGFFGSVSARAEKCDSCGGEDEEERLKIKDLAPARGGGALGSAPLPTTIATPAATALHSNGNRARSDTRAAS
jgi:hypothetical protein